MTISPDSLSCIFDMDEVPRKLRAPEHMLTKIHDGRILKEKKVLVVDQETGVIKVLCTTIERFQMEMQKPGVGIDKVKTVVSVLLSLNLPTIAEKKQALEALRERPVESWGGRRPRVVAVHVVKQILEAFVEPK